MTISHDWAKIIVDGGPLWVSRDAYKVDGVRRRFSAKQARAMAAKLGGRLITPRELDKRFAAAGLHNLPKPGNPVTRTDAEHSAAIDADIPSIDDDLPDDYEWIIGNTGKHWCHYTEDEPRKTLFVHMRPGREAEYGWHCDKHTKPHMPAPVHPSETDPDLWVIQRPWDSSHGDSYADYGMTLVIARDTQPDSWWEIDAEGFVVFVSRIDSIPPDTLPALSHGQRCVDWMRAQMMAGVCEEPDGSNNGPEVGEWLGACVRDGEPGIGKYLKARGANWCAAFASAADPATRRESDPAAPHKSRCSGFELESDAKGAGAWRPVQMAVSGVWDPEPGDIVTQQRGRPGSWKRHVTRFVGWIDRAWGTLETIGGNERNTICLTKRSVTELLGFIELPDSRPADVHREAPSDDPAPPADQLVFDGDNADPNW